MSSVEIIHDENLRGKVQYRTLLEQYVTVDKYLVQHYDTIYYDKANGRNGADGEKGERGKNGSAGSKGSYPGGAGGAGGNGYPGGNPTNGQHGENGMNLDSIVSGTESDEGIQISLEELGEVFKIPQKHSKITIKACGGNGGKGGKGGRGGDGGKGGKGGDGKPGSDGKSPLTHGACGENGGNGGNGGDGGNGGNGGVGSNGAMGGNAGSGGHIILRAMDTSFFIYFQAITEPGIPGAGGLPGKHGRGGAGGKGGKGGRGGQGGRGGPELYEKYTTSDGSRRTRCLVSGGSRGTDGRNGATGRIGNEGFTPVYPLEEGAMGKAGEKGSLTFTQIFPSGQEFSSQSLYNVICTYFEIIDEMKDGIFEPNQSVIISNIILQNVGGIPAPPNVTIHFPSTNSVLDISQHPLYRTAAYINPGESMQIRDAVFTLFIPRNKEEVKEEPYSAVASFHPIVSLRQIQFPGGSPIFDLKVRYPLELELKDADIGWPSQLAHEEVGVIHITVKNLSLITYGVDDKTSCYLRVTIDPSKLSFCDPKFNNQPQRIITINHLEAHSSINIPIQIKMKSEAEFYSVTQWKVELLLRSEVIEYRERSIYTSAQYDKRMKNCDVLLITSQNFSTLEYLTYKYLLSSLYLTFGLWDYNRNKGISIHSSTGQPQPWKEDYRGKMVIVCLESSDDLKLLHPDDIQNHFLFDSAVSNIELFLKNRGQLNNNVEPGEDQINQNIQILSEIYDNNVITTNSWLNIKDTLEKFREKEKNQFLDPKKHNKELSEDQLAKEEEATADREKLTLLIEQDRTNYSASMIILGVSDDELRAHCLSKIPTQITFSDLAFSANHLLKPSMKDLQAKAKDILTQLRKIDPNHFYLMDDNSLFDERSKVSSLRWNYGSLKIQRLPINKWSKIVNINNSNSIFKDIENAYVLELTTAENEKENKNKKNTSKNDLDLGDRKLDQEDLIRRIKSLRNIDIESHLSNVFITIIRFLPLSKKINLLQNIKHINIEALTDNIEEFLSPLLRFNFVYGKNKERKFSFFELLSMLLHKDLIFQFQHIFNIMKSQNYFHFLNTTNDINNNNNNNNNESNDKKTVRGEQENYLLSLHPYPVKNDYELFSDDRLFFVDHIIQYLRNNPHLIHEESVIIIVYYLTLKIQQILKYPRPFNVFSDPQKKILLYKFNELHDDIINLFQLEILNNNDNNNNDNNNNNNNNNTQNFDDSNVMNIKEFQLFLTLMEARAKELLKDALEIKKNNIKISRLSRVQFPLNDPIGYANNTLKKKTNNEKEFEFDSSLFPRKKSIKEMENEVQKQLIQRVKKEQFLINSSLQSLDSLTHNDKNAQRNVLLKSMMNSSPNLLSPSASSSSSSLSTTTSSDDHLMIINKKYNVYQLKEAELFLISKTFIADFKKKIWVSLIPSHQTLSFFASSSSSTPKVAISLPKATVEVVDDKDFYEILIKYDSKDYYLRCADEAQRDDWYSALQSVTNQSLASRSFYVSQPSPFEDDTETLRPLAKSEDRNTPAVNDDQCGNEIKNNNNIINNDQCDSKEESSWNFVRNRPRNATLSLSSSRNQSSSSSSSDQTANIQQNTNSDNPHDIIASVECKEEEININNSINEEFEQKVTIHLPMPPIPDYSENASTN